MTINFYNMSDEKNKVSKTVGTATSKTGTPVLPLDVMSPVVRVAFSSYPGYNYAYINSLSRYYFIVDKKCTADGIWDIYFSVDVLKSYDASIRASKAFVVRNENTYNADIMDPLTVQTTKINTALVNTTKIAPTATNAYVNWVAPSDWSAPDPEAAQTNWTLNYVTELDCCAYVSSGTEYAVPNGRLYLFGINTTMQTIAQSILNDTTNLTFLKSGLDLTEFVSKSSYMPMVPIGTHFTTVNQVKFKKSWLGTVSGVFTDLFDKTYQTGSLTGCLTYADEKLHRNCVAGWKVAVSSLKKFTDEKIYLNANTDVTVKFLPFGFCKFDILPHLNDDYIYFEVEADAFTGDAVFYKRRCLDESGITVDLGPRELLARGNIAVSLPSFSYTNDIWEKLSIPSLTEGLIKGGQESGTTGVLTSAITTMVPALTSQNVTNTAGNTGSYLIDSKPTIILKYNDYNTPSALLQGRPLYQQETLSSLTGFTQCSEVHLEFDALLPEINMIEDKLKEGVIL